MKKQFQQFIPLNEKEINTIWEKAIIIPDTNILLQIYRYTTESRGSFLKVLSHKNIKTKLWLPYQVGLEFHEHRVDVILEQTTIKDRLKSLINKSEQTLAKEINELEIRDEHPFLSKKFLIELVNQGMQLINSGIDTTDQNHPDLTNKDPLLDAVHDLFGNNFGKEPSKDMLKNIMQEADEEYKNKTGPGFEDSDKDGEKKYGDFIIWKEMLEKAKKEGLPVIFITNDFKKDWWQETKGKKIGIRYGLRKKFLKETGQEIMIYRGESFIKQANGYLDNSTNNEKLLKEMRDLQKQEDSKIVSSKYLDLRNHKLFSTTSLSKLVSREISNNKEKISEIKKKLDYTKHYEPKNKNTYEEYMFLEKILSDLYIREERLNRCMLLNQELNELKHIINNRNDLNFNGKNYMERVFMLQDELIKTAKIALDDNISQSI